MKAMWIGSIALAVAGCSIVYDTDKYEGTDSLPAPEVDAVPSPTNLNPLPLTGSGEPGAFVEVRGGSESVVSAAVGSDGSFSIDVPLHADAENMLAVSQVRGRAESDAIGLELVHDGTPPTTPLLDPAVSPTRRSQARLQGTAEAGSTVVVTGALAAVEAEVDAGGRFDVSAPLGVKTAEITQHDLAVVARDAAGNDSGPAIATIVHNPALPIEAPLIDPVPAFVNVTQVSISGVSEPDLTVRVFGGTSEVTATADATGAFSADVDLATNQANQLSVFATVEALGLSSPAAAVTVTHDDIPPDAPALDPEASPTAATTVRITGSSDTLASLDISGGAAAATGSADEAGQFAIDVVLSVDSVNTLSVTATDRAGNLGEPTTLDIEQDSTLEQPVVVDPVASPTSLNPITIAGTTEPDTDVEILGGAATATVTSAGDGTFSAQVTLEANVRNDLVVRRVGSSAETFVVVTHDDTSPGSPVVNAIASPTNQTNLVVSGTAEPSTLVSISGATSPASGSSGPSGQFSIPITIAEDATTSLLVIATDPAGNSSNPSNASVTHSSSVPDAPVLDDASPAPTSDPSHVVTGHVSEPGPGIAIEITGGAAVATGPTDPTTGAFSVEVTLSANTSNSLEVISIEGTIESPPSIASITHDDIAPSQPVGAAISVGSPTLGGCLFRQQVNTTGGTSAVEAFSTVRIANITAGTSVATPATATGTFTRQIAVCVGDVLSFTSIDAAGNTSTATEKTVP